MALGTQRPRLPKEEEAQRARQQLTLYWVGGGVAVAAFCAVTYLVLGMMGVRVKLHEPSPTEVNLLKVSTIYRIFKENNGGKAPPSMDDLRAWAKKNPAKLASLQIQDVDRVFVSPRDQQPFVLVPLPLGIGPVLAHEKSGAGGKVFMVSTVGSLAEVSEAQVSSAVQNTPVMMKRRR